MAEFNGFIAPTKQEAVSAYIWAKLARYNGDEIIEPTMEDVAKLAATIINTYAGELRTKIGTDIPFQGDVYQLKETEAKSFATDNSPDATKYPVMFAEAAARQMKPADVAAEYLYNSQAWPVLLAQIEAVRLGSLAKIQAAKSIADIEAVLASLEQ